MNKEQKINQILEVADEEILKDYARAFLLDWNEESINEQYENLFGNSEEEN